MMVSQILLTIYQKQGVSSAPPKSYCFRGLLMANSPAWDRREAAPLGLPKQKGKPCQNRSVLFDSRKQAFQSPEAARRAEKTRRQAL